MSLSSLPNVLVMLYRALKRISPLAPGFTRWQMFQPTRRIRDRVVLAPTCLNRHLSTVIGREAQPLLCPMHQEMWDLQLLPSFVGAIRSQKPTTFPAISHSLLLSSLASSFLNPFFLSDKKKSYAIFLILHRSFTATLYHQYNTTPKQTHTFAPRRISHTYTRIPLTNPRNGRQSLLNIRPRPFGRRSQPRGPQRRHTSRGFLGRLTVRNRHGLQHMRFDRPLEGPLRPRPDDRRFSAGSVAIIDGLACGYGVPAVFAGRLRVKEG